MLGMGRQASNSLAKLLDGVCDYEALPRLELAFDLMACLS